MYIIDITDKYQYKKKVYRKVAAKTLVFAVDAPIERANAASRVPNPEILSGKIPANIALGQLAITSVGLKSKPTAKSNK